MESKETIIVKDVAKYLNFGGATTADAIKKLKEKGYITFKIGDSEVSLSEDDLIIEASKKEGYITAIDGKDTVVLDTKLTIELIEEGYIREIVSKIQTMRKEANFEVMDKIDVFIYGDEYIEGISNNYKEMLLKDIMANNIIVGKSDEDAITKLWEINDKSVNIGIKK